MSRKKKKKSILKSRFYQVYFALVLLALIAIAIGTVWLNGVLRDYESAQPVYVAEDVAKLFEDSDFDALYALDTSAQQVSEGDKAFYVDSMNDIVAGKEVAWSEAYSSDADVRKYNVTVGGERFASFTLVHSGETTKRGNPLWTLGSVTTNVVIQKPEPTVEPTPTPEPERPLRQCRITAPKGYTVTVDGVALNEENAQLSEKNLFEDGFLPEDVPNPVMVDYHYATDSEAPAVTVTDDMGDAIEAEQSQDRELTWTCSLRSNENYHLQYGDAAYKLGQQVAKYISKDAKKTKIMKACAKDSPAAEIFKNLDNEFATPHSRVSFRNERTLDFFVLSDRCFTCRVCFDYVLNTSKGEMVYPTDYTFCVIRGDDGAKLYNILIS